MHGLFLVTRSNGPIDTTMHSRQRVANAHIVNMTHSEYVNPAGLSQQL